MPSSAQTGSNLRKEEEIHRNTQNEPLKSEKNLPRTAGAGFSIVPLHY